VAPLARRWVVGLLLLFDSTSFAKPGVRWTTIRTGTCEPPGTFYSSRHAAGVPPCCPAIEGVCPGGTRCPAGGICPDGKACKAGAVTGRPNIVLFVADDQGACHFGFLHECRSRSSGTAIPAPRTPNLDLLAGYGTVFPIAHNSASWCYPSLATMFTGRHQNNMAGARKLASAYVSTIPGALRGLETDASEQPDPYNAGNAIGGYCTLLGGKFTGALEDHDFDARTKTTRKLGRNGCSAGDAGEPPACGPSRTAAYSPFDQSKDNALSDVLQFLDALVYEQPESSPAAYVMPHFFVWFAPRIPHQPLRPPPVVGSYLFGAPGVFPFGGVMNLGRWCADTSCSPVREMLSEHTSASIADYYASVWWVDDDVRELRRYLAEMSAPHCVDENGHSRFDVADPTQCPGTWTGVSPDLPRSTIFIYLSDNGWNLPNSKHRFAENGYRTPLLVFDPRALPAVPSWNPELQSTPPPQPVEALAHAADILPTVLGYALGTPGPQECPLGAVGTACDGRDLRAHLVTAPGGPAAPQTLRHSLCAHQTSRVTSPGRNRYLLTRPGSVGRCTPSAGAACATAADCQAGEFCVGGHCAPAPAEVECSDAATCPTGAACLGARCRTAPPCLEDDDCAELVGPGWLCGAKEQRWCRNAPNVACVSADDCPVCPSTNGAPIPCGRSCEARILKLYVSSGSDRPGANVLVDLFLDPDEVDRYRGSPLDPTLLTTSMSSLTGPYAHSIRRMNCCIDDWWPEQAEESGTLCSDGFSCPADLVCNR
jgi:hypothetical protein